MIGTPFGHWHVSTFIGTLARKNEKLPRFWHIDTFVCGHVNHAGTYGTHGPRFSKLSKGNQAMKLDQLIEYNMRNIFREKLYTQCGGETIPTPFLKNQD